jgi:hypothetical protein
MNENVKYGAAGAAVVALSIGAVIYISQRSPDVPKPLPPVARTAPAPAPDEDTVKYPVPVAAPAEPLPKLDESDGPMLGALSDVFGKTQAAQYVVADGIVRKIVVTVDNLTAVKVAERLRPVRPVTGKFAVAGTEDAPTLDPVNYDRYKPMVQLIQSVDEDKLLAMYKRYYPLFQDAYENLGHPPKYFNDRLVEVIDHLLATPDLKEPIALTQPNVLYEYADPKLESLSAGQKVLIRMGSANAAVVKDKLRKLRVKLVEQKPGK